MGDLVERIQIFQNLLLAGPIIGATCAMLSVYVVLRRMSLVSEGVSHAGYGGVAVALLIGGQSAFFSGPIWLEVITGIFCVGTALLIGFVSRKKRVSQDAAIGIFLVATVAFGQLVMNMQQISPTYVENLLFGHFASVTRTDVYIVAAAMVLVFSIIAIMYYQFMYTALDEEMARVNGVNTQLVNVLLLTMISLVIVICVRMVGFFMITALTIIPGATANMISRRFGGVMLASLLIGILGTSAATWIAIFPPVSNYSAGPVIVLMLFAIFVVVWLYRHLIKPRPTLEEPPAAVHAPEQSFGHSH